ncbi:MAG TPA: alpha/beta fold hydrolase [Gammaproteobacteria bacterium]|nr:alpha/beta fold hydrolase [Gammaproteobacteria bacterium]
MSQLAHVRRGKGEPLVLVHGYLGGSAMWQGQIDYFSLSHDVIAPDLAGFGNSADRASPDTIEGHAHLIFRFLDDLGVENFNLMGHSMGGMIVQQMAAMAAQRVRRLILFGTGPVGMLPNRFETIKASRQHLQHKGLAFTTHNIAATWFVAGEQASGFALCLREGVKATMQAALASLSACEKWDGTSALATLSMPTMVVWGDRDRSYGWSQPESLWRGIRGARLAVLPGCAHNAHHEKPALFNAIVEDFLTSKV